jgi:hypothetical protein
MHSLHVVFLILFCQVGNENYQCNLINGQEAKMRDARFADPDEP